jgi:cation transport ATPase
MVGFIIILGCILLIIPGIYWAGLYGLAVPAVVLENITASDALSRSSTLAKGSVGRVIVVYFLAAVFAIIMSLVLEAILSAGGLAFRHNGAAKAAWNQVISTMTTILFGPISAIAITLVYYDQRIRREAFDISHMMSLMNKTGNNLEAQGMNS